MKSKVYNINGKEVGSVILPSEIFDLDWNPNLVHQVVYVERLNKRKGTAHAKARSEVRGGGKKPWRQKGTGRARHGSIRSPIWIGGGVTHGPRKEKNYFKKINKKAKRKALLISLSQKMRDNEVLILDKFSFPQAKTKEADKSLSALSKIKNFERLNWKNSSRLVLLPSLDQNTARAVRNIPRTKTYEARNLNILDLLNYKYVLLPKESIKTLKETFFGKDRSVSEEKK